MDESIKIKGNVEVKVTHLDGSSEDYSFHNLVVNSGKAQLALLAGDSSAAPFTYLAVGTSSTSPSASQTTLGSEITDSGLERASATVSRATVSVTNDTLQLIHLWNVSASKTIEEVGIFNAASSGEMLSRALTGSIVVVNTDTVTITYKVTFS